jgi:hypothetical protein
LLTFVVIWVGGLGLIFGCILRRQILMKKVEGNKKAHERQVRVAQMSRSPVLVREYLTGYVKSVFPLVFGSRSRLLRLVDEIKRHHRYILMFTAAPGSMGDRKRTLSGVQLLTVQSLLLFLLAVFYDLGSPYDDGSCEGLGTEEECLSRKSVLDSSQSYCQWELPSSTSTANLCSYGESSMSWRSVIYVAIIVSLISSVLMHPLDALFDNLSAPLADKIKLAEQQQQLRRNSTIGNAARRISVTAANITTSIANNFRGSKRRLTAGATTRVIPDAIESALELAQHSGQLLAAHTETHRLTRLGQIASMKAELLQQAYDDRSGSSGSNGRSVRQASMASVSSSTSSSAARRVSPVDDRVSQKYASLVDDIKCQRRLLRGEEIDEFDT